ncbi:hypothetical protein GGR92_003494 [Spirosoma lacussanchae]|uniref:hypothetical protein n=1 Tax=Spirosoma lacussanchae TaxID=1884249 RepID=UPI0011088AAE|nr:hypothetical protein [Spirosoma lacussanchae]
MKKALFVTNCSVDSALALCNWAVENDPESIALTVVHPYDLESWELNKQAIKEAKQRAQDQLGSWLKLLDGTDGWPGTLQTETLMASPRLAATIHLLLRTYDYVVVEDPWHQTPLVSAELLRRSGAQLCPLAESAGVLR